MSAPFRSRQHGAALLMAMIIVALVATLASAMIWQQWRAVQVETAERTRAQSSWILTGALDWSQLILKEDARADYNKSKGNNPKIPFDGLDEPWATPLAEARLSTFLAADQASTEDGPEAFLSGDIADAQARFNVMRLVDTPQNSPATINPTQLLALKTLCNVLDVSQGTADLIAKGLLSASSYDPNEDTNTPLMPKRVDQLIWLGVDPVALKRLEPFLWVYDEAQSSRLVNINTASREVIAAVLPGINLGDAESLIQARKKDSFKTNQDIIAVLPGMAQVDLQKIITFRSTFFEVRGRMRIGDRVLEQKALVERTLQPPYTATLRMRDDTSLRDVTN